MITKDYMRLKINQIPKIVIQCLFVTFVTIFIVHMFIHMHELQSHLRFTSPTIVSRFITEEAKNALLLLYMVIGLSFLDAVLELRKEPRGSNVSILHRPSARVFSWLLTALSLWTFSHAFLLPTSFISIVVLIVSAVICSSAQVLLVIILCAHWKRNAIVNGSPDVGARGL